MAADEGATTLEGVMKNTSRRNIAAAELKTAFSIIREGAPFAELLSIAHLNGAQAVILGHTNGLVWAEKNIKPMATRMMESAWKKHKRLVRNFKSSNGAAL